VGRTDSQGLDALSRKRFSSLDQALRICARIEARRFGIVSTGNESISVAGGEKLLNLFESRATHINAGQSGVSSEKSAPLFGVLWAIREVRVITKSLSATAPPSFTRLIRSHCERERQRAGGEVIFGRPRTSAGPS
jgi:hypothetical protein